MIYICKGEKRILIPIDKVGIDLYNIKLELYTYYM